MTAPSRTLASRQGAVLEMRLCRSEEAYSFHEIFSRSFRGRHKSPMLPQLATAPTKNLFRPTLSVFTYFSCFLPCPSCLYWSSAIAFPINVDHVLVPHLAFMSFTRQWRLTRRTGRSSQALWKIESSLTGFLRFCEFPNFLKKYSDSSTNLI